MTSYASYAMVDDRKEISIMGANIYEAVKQAIQDIVAPSLRAIEGQIEATRVELRSEIRRLDDKIDSGFHRLDDKIEGLDKRIDSLRGEFSSRFESLEREVSTAINIHERLAAVEAKLASMH